MSKKALAPGSIIAGRYRIVRELGRGGMGAVYVVEHVNTGGQWALKVMLSGHLDDSRAARFRREARASARVTSEHVVKVTDADMAAELGDAPFLVMELLEGEDLERRLTTKGRIPKEEVADIITQVGRGLDRAHAAGVIHRDLKPDNVFLHRREDGTTIVKLLDFGISKLLNDDTATAVTKTSDVFGTPLYMSPEQASGRHEQIGPATDIWAVALVTFRILTGQLYWTAETVPTLILQIVSPERELPSSRHPALGPAFDRWFLKSLATDPKDRWRTVGEQAAALALALAEPIAHPGDEGTVLLPTAPTAGPVSVLPRSTPSGTTKRGIPAPPATPPPIRHMPSTPPSASRVPGASTESPIVTNAPYSTRRRSRALAFFGVAAIGVVIGGLVLLAVLAAEPDAKEGASAHPPPHNPPSAGAVIAPPAVPDAAPAVTVAVVPSATPSATASAKPYGKARPLPTAKPKASSSSQTDQFDTQK